MSGSYGMRERLWKEHYRICFWCGEQTYLYGRNANRSHNPRDMATVDHIYSRNSYVRTRFPECFNRIKVLSCFGCNNDRSFIYDDKEHIMAYNREFMKDKPDTHLQLFLVNEVEYIPDELNKSGRGYTLHDIIDKDDEWWEHTHDFIQWLFPDYQPSSCNKTAPIWEGEKYEKPIADLVVARFLKFLKNYYVTGHNALRITRAIKSMRNMGYDGLASKIYFTVMRSSGIKNPYWDDAIKGLV